VAINSPNPLLMMNPLCGEISVLTLVRLRQRVLFVCVQG